MNRLLTKIIVKENKQKTQFTKQILLQIRKFKPITFPSVSIAIKYRIIE